MKQNKNDSWVDAGIGLAVIVIVVVALCSIVPFILIFIMNTLASMGGSDFHIDHGFVNYLLIYVVMLCLGLVKGLLK